MLGLCRLFIDSTSLVEFNVSISNVFLFFLKITLGLMLILLFSESGFALDMITLNLKFVK